MTANIFHQFYENNRGVVVSHVTLTLLTFPLEILLLSYISGIIFQRIRDKNYKAFFVILVGFFFAFLFIQVLHFLQDYMSSLIIPRLDTFARTELLNIMLNHRYEEDSLRVGEMMHRISKMPGHLYKNYSNTVNYIVPLCFSLVFFTGYLLWIHWKIGALAAGVFIILFVSYFYVFRYLAKESSYRFHQEHDLMDAYEDTITNWESIRMANTREKEKERMTAVSQDFEAKQKQEIHRVNTLKISAVFLFNMFMVLLLVFGVYLSSQQKAFPYWKLIILITAILLMSRTLTTLVVRSSDSIYHSGSMQHFKDFMTEFDKKQVTTTTAPTTHPSTTPTTTPVATVQMENFDIVFDHVSYRYPGSDKDLLQEVSFRVPFLSNLLVIGAVGSGKSTMLKMLLGFFHPTSGRVTIGGVPVNEYHPEYLMDHVAYMNQNALLFNRTLLENIFYGREPDREALLALHEFIPPRIMENLDSMAGKQGNQLSGGERQIVLLLRMYFKPHEIVLLDEPTANLDPASRNRVMDLIQVLMKKKTVLCITHDYTLEPIFHNTYRIH